MATTSHLNSTVGATPVWSWTFRGAPIRVCVPQWLISRLQAEIDTQVASDAGGETGGILLGRKRRADSTLELEGYAWVSREREQDGKYGLNTTELERMCAEHEAKGQAVVGYFRTESGVNLELRSAEIELIRKYFPDPQCVALLIQTSTTPYNAGFFFWMSNGVLAPLSFLDFPLDVARLQFHTEPGPDEPGPETEFETGVSAEPEEEPAVLIQGETEDEKAPVRLMPVPESPAPRRRAAAAGSSKPKSPSNTFSSWPESALPRTGAPKRTRVTTRTLWVVAALIAIMGIASGTAYLFRDRWLIAPRQKAISSAASAAQFPLQLEVEAQGSGLNVRWNRESGPVTRAHDGRLVIFESDQAPVIIPLTPQQLTIGHVYYQSSAARLEFQLEIVENSGEVLRESVLALSNVPHAQAPTPPVSTSGERAAPRTPEAAQAPVRKVESIPLSSTRTDGTGVELPSEPVAQSSRSAARSFTPPSTKRGDGRVPTIDEPPAVFLPSRPNVVAMPSNALVTRVPAPPAPAPSAIGAAPVNAPAANAAPTNTPVASASSINVAPASAAGSPAQPQPTSLPAPTGVTPAPAASAAAQAPMQPIRIAGAVQAAKLIKKVAPVYPSLALATRVQGIVRFNAVIGKDGAVRSLQVMSGAPMLVQAATDAVKQWRYSPTFFSGQPVEVVTQVDVNFKIGE